MKSIIRQNYKLTGGIFVILLLLFIVANAGKIFKGDIASWELEDYGYVLGYVTGTVVSLLIVSICIVLLWRGIQYMVKKLRR